MFPEGLSFMPEWIQKRNWEPEFPVAVFKSSALVPSTLHNHCQGLMLQSPRQ